MLVWLNISRLSSLVQIAIVLSWIVHIYIQIKLIFYGNQNENIRNENPMLTLLEKKWIEIFASQLNTHNINQLLLWSIANLQSIQRKILSNISLLIRVLFTYHATRSSFVVLSLIFFASTVATSRKNISPNDLNLLVGVTRIWKLSFLCFLDTATWKKSRGQFQLPWLVTGTRNIELDTVTILIVTVTRILVRETRICSWKKFLWVTFIF